jgi:hypothetical protein
MPDDWYARRVPDPAVPTSPNALTPLLTFGLGFLSAIFAEPLRQLIFQPVLRVEFETNAHCVAKTQIGEPPTAWVHYIRVKVTNTRTRIAKSCRAYLVGIQRRGPSGAWEATDYCEALPLGWSARPDVEHGMVDIPKGVPHYVDVLSTKDTSNSFHPAIVFTPYRIDGLLAAQGTYLLTILVTGDALKPAQIRLLFKWTGVWNAYEVSAA